MPPPPDLDWEARVARRRAAHSRVVRQRRIAACAVLIAVIAGLVAGLGAFAGGGAGSRPTGVKALVEQVRKAAAKPLELPRGGRRLFPHYRVVAYYGAPQNVELGALGIGTPAQAGRRLVAQMRPYRRGGRHLLPAMELIAVVAAGSARKDGSYNTVQSDAVVRRYLAAARKLRALLILDIQPGHGDFMTLTRHFEKFLREPDVGLALDPEWATPNAVPGKVIGSTDAATVNRVSMYLAQLVKRYKLPQKLLVVHEFTDSMIRNKPQLHRRRDIAMVLNVDGFGDPPNKIVKYNDFTHPPTRFRNGFKVFYKEDTNMMSPAQVLELRPRPDLVIYE